MAKKKDTFYLEETTLNKLKQISEETLISKNKLLERILTDFFKYYDVSRKVMREIDV